MTEQTPSTRAGLRDEIADALEAADYSGSMRRGDLADSVMPVLYREWPWLRAEAEEYPTAAQVRAEMERLAYGLDARGRAIRQLRERAGEAEGILALVGERCDTADILHKPVTTGDVRAWLKGSRCARETAAGKRARTTVNNPPGSTCEQLPAHLLALIDVPSYASTACEAAASLATAARAHAVRRDQLDQWAGRLHARCRTNNKFTGAPCRCGCHTATEEQRA